MDTTVLYKERTRSPRRIARQQVQPGPYAMEDEHTHASIGMEPPPADVMDVSAVRRHLLATLQRHEAAVMQKTRTPRREGLHDLAREFDECHNARAVHAQLGQGAQPARAVEVGPAYVPLVLPEAEVHLRFPEPAPM